MATFSNNTTPQKKLLQSIGTQYYGEGLNGKRALSVRYLEDMIVFSIHKPLPEAQQTTNSVYDYKSGIQICIKPKSAKAFGKCVKKAINYLSEGNDFQSMGINSASGLIEVSDGTKFNMSNPGLTIAIYTDIDDGCKAGSYEVFQFTEGKAILDYDFENGSHDTVSLDTDAEYFLDQITEFVKASNNASAHFIKKEMNYNIGLLTSRQYDIMNKLGIAGDNGTRGFGGSTNWVARETGRQPATVTRPNVVNTNEDDLLSELDNM